MFRKAFWKASRKASRGFLRIAFLKASQKISRQASPFQSPCIPSPPPPTPPVPARNVPHPGLPITFSPRDAWGGSKNLFFFYKNVRFWGSAKSSPGDLNPKPWELSPKPWRALGGSKNLFFFYKKTCFLPRFFGPPKPWLNPGPWGLNFAPWGWVFGGPMARLGIRFQMPNAFQDQDASINVLS